MNDEQIENQLEDRKKVNDAGFSSLESYLEFRHHATSGLATYGDVFGKALGLALFYADLDNALKITRYWHQLCEQHVILNKISIAQKRKQYEEQTTSGINESTGTIEERFRMV
jgi:hypothetical protein